MRILHYSLGLQPYRTGGLTVFCTDLIKAQQENGDEVFLLWPGRMRRGGRVGFKKHLTNNINNYELVNPLPVPLDEGIIETDAFMKPIDNESYDGFLKKIRPEIIHVHTLMGLHREFVEAAHNNGIPVIFTTHDFFGISTKAALLNDADLSVQERGGINYKSCNSGALSMKKIRLLQSPLYRYMKNTALVRLLRKKHRAQYFGGVPELSVSVAKQAAGKYKKLQEYYIGMVGQMDLVHYNSHLAKEIYEEFIKARKSEVITISDLKIEKDTNNREDSDGKKIRMAFLAAPKPWKGFLVLKDALDELWANGKRDFSLDVFASVDTPSEYMNVREDGYGFDRSGLQKALSGVDVMIAPSIGYDTFGLTTLEALSCGVPAIVSRNVGAKEVIGKGGIVIDATKDSVKNVILSLTRERIIEMQDDVRNTVQIKAWPDFVNECDKMYRRVVDEYE